MGVIEAIIKKKECSNSYPRNQSSLMETDCLILLLSANKIRVWRKISKNINEDAAAIMAD